MRGMGVNEIYGEMGIADIPAWAQARKRDGWRFVQLLAISGEHGADLLYSLRKEDAIEGMFVRGVGPGERIPSITDSYLAAFTFENEIHDLFGVSIEGIAIDFGGAFYKLSAEKPMSVLSPEALAARRKAAEKKAREAAKRAKEEAEASGAAKGDAAAACALSGTDAPAVAGDGKEV